MIRTTVKISGIMCGRCEAHINDAIRAAFPVKKVSGSHGRRDAVILSEVPPDAQKLWQIIDATGYTFVSAQSETAAEKGLLARLFGR